MSPKMRFRQYTSPNENFEYGYPHSNAMVTFLHKNVSQNIGCSSQRPVAASFINPLVSCIKSLFSL